MTMERSVAASDSSFILNLLKHKLPSSSSTILSAQIQKHLPGVSSVDSDGGKLHFALTKFSRESFSHVSKHHPGKQQVCRIPRKSVPSAEVTFDEYVINDSKTSLFASSFIRNLPVPIEDKRHYRRSCDLGIKRKSWYKKFSEYVSEKYEAVLPFFDIWSDTLKTIEGQQGTAVVSYFFFLRWLVFMNALMFLCFFVTLLLPHFVFSKDRKFEYVHSIFPFSQFNRTRPETEEVAFALNANDSFRDRGESPLEDQNSTEALNKRCMKLYSQEILNNSESGVIAAIQNILQGTGSLEYSHLFIGVYPPYDVIRNGVTYNTAFVVLITAAVSFCICLFMMLKYSSIGIEETFQSRRKGWSHFSNEVFSAWDYCISSPPIAEAKHSGFFLNMKTMIMETKAEIDYTTRTPEAWLKIYAIRFGVNFFSIVWLCCCYYIIYFVKDYEMSEMEYHNYTGLKSLFLQFLSPCTIITLNVVTPQIFAVLVVYEKYRAETVIHITLFRSILMYLSYIMVLLYSIYQHVGCDSKDECGVGVTESCRSPRCWETYIGQQMYKFTIVDLLVYFAIFLGFDVVWYCIYNFFDNSISRLLGPLEFYLPTEVLYPVYSQSIIWTGVFYSPLLPGIMVLKLIVIFYLKKIKALKLCQPSIYSFRPSRFNAVFIAMLLIAFFTVLIGRSYALERIRPSRGCSPFRQLEFIIFAIPERIRKSLWFLSYGWTYFVAWILLCWILYYYWSIISFKKKLIDQWRMQLLLNNMDKQFLLRKITELDKNLLENNSS